MDRIVAALREVPRVEMLHAISGEHDLIAVAVGNTTREVDETLDRIGKLTGVEKTLSSIILSTKFDRS